MINVDTINRYLKDHDLPADDGYLLKDAGEGVFIAKWDLDIPKPTISQMNSYAAEILSERPDKDWEASMKESDNILPKYVEDIIDVLTQTQRNLMAKDTLDKYNNKKILRSKKPV